MKLPFDTAKLRSLALHYYEKAEPFLLTGPSLFLPVIGIFRYEPTEERFRLAFQNFLVFLLYLCFLALNHFLGFLDFFSYGSFTLYPDSAAALAYLGFSLRNWYFLEFRRQPQWIPVLTRWQRKLLGEAAADVLNS